MKIRTKIVSILAAGFLLVSCGESAKDDGLEGPFDLSSSVTKPNEEASGFYGDIIYGDKDAPVTIVEYASLTCGACANFHISSLPQIKKELIDTGRAKLVFRNFIRGAHDMAAASFARCIDNEDNARNWHNKLFENQRSWYNQNVDPIQELAMMARKAGISRAKFDRCAVNTDMQKYLNDMLTEARTKLNVNSTPTIYVQGMKVPDYGFETIEKAVARAEK